MDLKRARILGKHWGVRFVNNLGDKYADCDPPDTPNKVIRFKSGLSDKDLLDAIIHECCHIGWWPSDESHVNEFATDLANLLWKLGYRRSNPE